MNELENGRNERKEEKENGLPPGTRKFLLVRGVALSENNCSTALNGTTSFYFQRQKNARQGVALFQNRSTALIAKKQEGTTFFTFSTLKKYDKKTKEEKEKSPRGRCLTAFDANSDKSASPISRVNL